ncbi:Protein CBG26558 [Caenorhabditis briggsae]|uniref:Protein CBG26558 n=1 Tax=Caenorhabditis briggsae TaxID=6238 RepID=B6IGZ2_CAEBR|nr:Protein CBG26558 [Caenorhabditis briggsae]CAR99172.1 Protein CBG26558 [Caenorhabditis briggsae]
MPGNQPRRSTAIVTFSGPHLFLLLILPIAAYCQSKKKFEADGRADLIPRKPPIPAPTPPKDDNNSVSSIQAAPHVQNVKSLPPEKSDAPTSGKMKKKK